MRTKRRRTSGRWSVLAKTKANPKQNHFIRRESAGLSEWSRRREKPDAAITARLEVQHTFCKLSSVLFDRVFSRPSHDEPVGRVMGRAGDVAGYVPAYAMLKYAFSSVCQVSCSSSS